jgi:hypothetical protein
MTSPQPTMYSTLACRARESRGPDGPPPDTIMTKQIETIDNDRAYALWAQVGIS